MNNITFYPMINTDMLEACGLSVSEYTFLYEYGDQEFELVQQGNPSSIKLTDPNTGIWTNVDDKGLRFTKEVRIAYPNLLKGKNGVACTGAKLGICIIWTNNALTRTGIIYPSSDNESPTGRVCIFDYCFGPRQISGDLSLSLTMYIKKSAESVLPDEADLINEEGVTVGEIETVTLDLKKIHMDFPIEECRSDTEPLWWVEFAEWEDPKSIDRFSRESFCLFLNTHYGDCPIPVITPTGSTIKNLDLMVDILAQTYLMIIERLSDEDKKATVNDTGLESGSICSVLHHFVDRGSLDLQSPPEKLLKGLQIYIRQLLTEKEA